MKYDSIFTSESETNPIPTENNQSESNENQSNPKKTKIQIQQKTSPILDRKTKSKHPTSKKTIVPMKTLNTGFRT